MSTKVFKYILDFKAQTDRFGKEVGGVKGMLKGAAVAAGALFAVDKVMDAAAAVADYAQEISKVNAEVTKLTGLQGAAADTMTGQVQAIAKAYEQDVNESLLASNAIMKAFGESSAATFDVLNAGFATTANSNGDFLKQVKEYSIQFEEAGLAASEMVAIIAEGNKMGVFDDKAADSIKEGSIRLREMTKSTREALNGIGLSADVIQRSIENGSMSMFEVMQQVSRQLETLPRQSPAVGAALADIFGGPGEDGIQFIRTLGDINTNLDEVVDKAGGAAATQIAWSNELKEFHTVGAQVFGGTNRLITTVKTVTLGWVNDSIRGVANLINYFIDLYNESMTFRGAIEALKFTFETTFDFIKLQWKTVLNYFKGAGKVIKAIFTGDWQSIGDIVKSTFEDIKADGEDFGKQTAESFSEAVTNTLTPREKVKLISLSSEDATAAGIETGKNFAKGFIAGRQQMQPAQAIASLGAQVDFLPEKAIKNIGEQQYEAGAISFSPQLGDMSYFNEQINAAKENIADMSEDMQAKVWAIQGAFEQGFNAIGASVVNGMGLANDGMEGFVKGMAQVAAQFISIMAAEAIAAAIKGASLAATFTGPAAPFAQPGFIATMVGGVLAAFAAIPKFEFGGIVPGNSFSGDRMLARLNSGEEVLRRDDPRHINNYGKASAAGSQAPRDRIIIPTVKIRKGDIYIAYEEGRKEMSKRNGN